jgi:hypothetical protein
MPKVNPNQPRLFADDDKGKLLTTAVRAGELIVEATMDASIPVAIMPPDLRRKIDASLGISPDLPEEDKQKAREAVRLASASRTRLREEAAARHQPNRY